jgi:YVTN family beta-propeller protein
MSDSSARSAWMPGRARRRRLPGISLIASLAVLAGALALGHTSVVQADGAEATALTTRAATTTGAMARPGTNLLRNSDGTAGDTSAQGWDAVTIPGWQIRTGLPTVVRYGTSGFPKAATMPKDPGNLFVGGAGGTATLVQTMPVTLRQPSASPVRYTISAWLGGTKTSAATLTVRFRAASGATEAVRSIGPVGRPRGPVLQRRTATGTLPKGVASAEVTLTLATTLTNVDGPYAPLVGYDYASATGLGLTFSAPAQRPAPLAPPTPSVPRYQHVFLFYFENEDYSDVIGNVRQAPYLNSLRKDGATLADFYAEEHPSDANYLAFAGGSTFGVPLDDPQEENPLYTIDAPNIGDLVDSAHETWKTYTQSANGPCDDTVHDYYWNDDQPMLYFADVRDRPAYCAAHVVPLEELGPDLRTAASTPNFAWVAPNDCTDMEGCGIAAGDAFLKTELTQIMNSPAWRTQRSLAIITFDEDATDNQHPAQRVPTLVVASQGVRRGYTDPARYTHYSMLRTVEAALGLGTLTANDLYAPAFNTIFKDPQTNHPERTRDSATPSPSLPPRAEPVPPPAAASGPANPTAAVSEPAKPTAAASTATAIARFLASAARARQPIAWVANYGSASVSPVNLATRKAGPAIAVGSGPRAIVATPNGKTIYVANSFAGTVTPIDARTGQAARPIRVGTAPWALAMTPDGKTLYVANSGSGTVTPIATATNRPGRPIPVGRDPRAIAMAPDGSTAYVLNWLGATVTPIATATGQPGRPIPVGAFPVAYAFGAGASTLYIANFGADSVTPIDTQTGRAATPLPAGYAPNALAATADGTYAVDGNSDELTKLGTDTTTRVGYSPDAIALSGTNAYVVNTIDGTVTPVDARTGKAARPINVGAYSYPTDITITGHTAVVLEPYGYAAVVINLTTGRVYAPVTVGGYPTAVAITA